MRQLVYISSAAPSVGESELASILATSQRNNARDGVTGLLFFNGRRFLQALEGDDDAVASALERIGTDDRHRALVILSDRQIDDREFGAWAMESAVSDSAGAFLGKVGALVAGAAPNVKATFESFAALPTR